MAADLRCVFSPRTVAVIGASADLTQIGGRAVQTLLAHGFQGEIYPINPKYAEVAGLRCYPNVRSVPAEVDLAVIAIGAAHVPGILRQCGEKGVHSALIFSAGFAETGEEGRRLQEEIAEIARQTNMRLVGPNCQGLMNIPEGVWAGFGAPFALDRLRAGSVSMATQSGGFGYAAVGLAEEEGVGFRYVVSTGNEADLDALQFMEFFLDDPQTEVVAGYIEGFKDGRRFRQIAETALERRKPLVIWKVGDSDVGQKAAASHTANLGGAAALYRAVFREKGVQEVGDVYELADLARAFRGGKLPAGNRVGIVTISGGAGVLLADYCVAHGLELPPLSDATKERLRGLVPSFASLLNPVDVTAHIFNDPALLERALDVLVDEERLDSLVILNASLSGELALRVAREIARASAATPKPIFVAWSARANVGREAFALLDDARVPYFRTPVRAGRGLAALVSYARALERLERERAEPHAVAWKSTTEAVGLLQSYPVQPAEYQAKEFLSRCGIPVTQEYLATSVEEALAAAHRIGYPVVTKIQSSDIPHKTEAGGVRVGIRSDDELRQAFQEVLEGAKRYRPGAAIDGVLVQEMVSGAVEVILGVLNDPLFGPSVMFGLGGIFTEVMRDVSFRVAPITRVSAEEMVREIKGYPVLKGARGKPPCDVSALVEVLQRLSWVAAEMKDEIAEMDINPLFVLPEGRGVRVGDALIRRRVVES